MTYLFPFYYWCTTTGLTGEGHTSCNILTVRYFRVRRDCRTCGLSFTAISPTGKVTNVRIREMNPAADQSSLHPPIPELKVAKWERIA